MSTRVKLDRKGRPIPSGRLCPPDMTTENGLYLRTRARKTRKHKGDSK